MKLRGSLLHYCHFSVDLKYFQNERFLKLLVVHANKKKKLKGIFKTENTLGRGIRE